MIQKETTLLLHAVTGSIKWVHRRCLNEWRAVSPNPTSFSRCDVCHQDYQMEFVGESKGCPKCYFAFLLSRDFLVFFLSINLFAFLCSLFLWGVDRDRARDKVFTEWLDWANPPPLFLDWLYGWLLFFFIVGILSIMAAIMAWLDLCCCTPPTYSTYNYGWGGYYCWVCYVPPSNGGSDCDCGGCSGCDGDCNGNNDGSILIVLAVIVIIIIVVGLIVATVMGVMLGIRIVKRHWHVLHARREAGSWQVVDLASPSYTAGEDIV
ncbi:CYSTM domain-containing protein [Balamuthia mandrillaris]